MILKLISLGDSLRPWRDTIQQRLHVAVRLFSNRSQMTSKCGKNKWLAHEAKAECAPDEEISS